MTNSKDLFVICIDLIESVFRKKIMQILPNSEKSLLPPLIRDVHSFLPLYDYIFVFEKCVNCHIIPQMYKIYYSQKYMNNIIVKENINRINALKKLLVEGDNNVNSTSYNYIPKSANRYYASSYGDENKSRYNCDFSTDMFGIRHFHLTSQSDDILLFYCVVNENIYFIDIGNHHSFFSDRNIRTVISEFPELLDSLRIIELKELFTLSTNSSEFDYETIWKSGLNKPFIIDGKSYIGNIQTYSHISINNKRICDSIIYSIENGINEIIDNNSIDDIELNKVRSRLSIPYGSLFFTDKSTKKEYQLIIPYTQIIDTINKINA